MAESLFPPSEADAALPLLDTAQLIAALQAQAPEQLAVICVSQRLAQHLLRVHGDAQLAAGRGAWETPTILTLDSFLRTQYETVRLERERAGTALLPLLGVQAQRLLWRTVLAQSRSEQPLLRESEAAQLAAEAWALVHEYGLSLPLSGGSSDVERFNVWAQAYAEQCVRLRRLDPAQHRERLLHELAAQRLPVPPTIVFAGFEQSTPLLQQSLAAFAAAGCQRWRWQPPTRQGTVAAVCAASPEQELRAAAAWVRMRVEADPEARVGVVVPDLAARRATVQRLFDEQLCADRPGTAAARPYNLTLGEPLASLGLIRTALQWLQLWHGGLGYADAGALLNSPYWGDSEDERLRRAALDARLRAEGHLQVDLELLWREAQDLPGFAQTLRQLREWQHPQRRLAAGEWAERISQLLVVAGWPGARPLDSSDYQAWQAWRNALLELGRLDPLLGRVPFSAALTQLRELLEHEVFQPQSPPSRIQVMGALEAVGMDFDHLWVVGLDDERWPPPGRPHPFLPYALQREQGLPHAAAAQELAYAQHRTAQWCVAADDVRLSWPRQEGDRPLAPSPLIASWASNAQELQIDDLPESWSAQQQTAQLETLLDAQAPPPLPGAVLSGGARLLGDQARCPFRGYATHRLGARALEVPGYGPSAIDRGNAVHLVLELLWRELRDQAGLLALDDDALAARIGAAVDQVLHKLVLQAPQRLRPQFRELEALRLRQLIRAWLEQERLRLPFRVIELEGRAPDQDAASMSDDTVEFEGLKLRLRPDRIDQLDDGGCLVLDYKTGSRLAPPWADGRPEEPQLLIYALRGAGAQEVLAVAFGRVLAGSTGFVGIAAGEGVAPGIRALGEVRGLDDSSWTAMFGRWRGQLATLAGEVREGWAAVTPKHPRQTCRDCDLHALCRIRESVAVVAEDEGDSA